MGIIRAENLSYNYVRRDENDKIIAVTHALKNINIDIVDTNHDRKRMWLDKIYYFITSVHLFIYNIIYINYS